MDSGSIPEWFKPKNQDFYEPIAAKRSALRSPNLYHLNQGLYSGTDLFTVVFRIVSI